MSRDAVRDGEIIAQQARQIARLRADLELAEQHDADLWELIVERFNPPDDDSIIAYGVIEGAADFIEKLPCECTAEQIEDLDACARCHVLGRIGDKPLVR